MREAIKQSLFHTLQWTGMNALARRRFRNSLVVLNYHGVQDGEFRTDRHLYINTVSSAEFEAHLQLVTRHFQPVRASDVESWVSGERDLPERAILLTFDDGFRNNLTHAAPLLKRHGVPAILFLATAYIGGTRILWPQELYELGLRWPRERVPLASGEFNLTGDRRARAKELVAFAKTQPADAIEPWLNALREEAPLPSDLHTNPVYEFLTWDEVRQLPAYGFEIGSHTHNHPIMARCSGERMTRELEVSKNEIESRLGIRCGSFCYPNGGPSDWSEETGHAVQAAGYRAAYTLLDRMQERASVQPFRIDRLVVPGGVAPTVFAARVSGSIAIIRRLWPGL